MAQQGLELGSVASKPWAHPTLPGDSSEFYWRETMLARHIITMQKDIKAKPGNQMKSASTVVTFGPIIIYIHAQCAKEDLTPRKLSGDSKLKGLQMPGKK